MSTKKTGKSPSKKKAATEQAKEDQSLILVGVGSSAGGLEALRPFVAGLAKNSNMAYVIAQHMSPQHRSMMADLLSRETDLPVREVEHGIVPCANTVYICPPNSDVFVKEGVLGLRKPLSEIGAKPSVDYLFTSLAEEFGERAIGIVLSGTGSDGSHGMRAINAAGGICIAQKPDSAKYDSMPVSAIKAGADLILAPDEIATQLASISMRPRVPVSAIDEGKQNRSPLEAILHHIYDHTKMDFANYKESTLTRQIERRMAVLQINALEDYVKMVASAPDELEALANNFLVCVTSFFRDGDAFEAFSGELNELLATKKPGDDIRIWVPGCATGEEAYSIAIILAEKLGDQLDAYKVQVFATDMNADATQFGRRGLYPETSVEGMDDAILRKYFHPNDRFFQVDRRIRDMVVFANQDLIQDPPFVRVDAVTCRNLLIYFKTGLQEKVFQIFHYALKTGGILFLGKSESVGQNNNLFSEIDRKAKLFRKRDVQSALPSSFTGIPLLALHSKRQIEKEKKAHITPTESGRSALLSAYAPPSVLASSEGTILEFYGDVTPYMKLMDGKADFNLFSIVHPPLRTELRAIMQKVIRSRDETHTRPVKLLINGEEKLIRTSVRPTDATAVRDDHVLVSFENVQQQAVVEVGSGSMDEAAEARIAELDHELTMTRESLQTVIEELETSNEELQSMNEEAQAANEELQASNEELETSNEELQATNEELTTVNDELSVRTNEVAEALSDMENIQNNSGQAIVVLDSDLRIRRHNQFSLSFFKIDPALSPQALSSVPLYFEYSSILDDVKEVQRSHEQLESEFSLNDRYYALQIIPYQENDSRYTGGTIITIRDITELAANERVLRLSEDKLSNALQIASAGNWEYDVDSDLFTFNDNFYRIFKTTVKDAGGYQLSSSQYAERFCHPDEQGVVAEEIKNAIETTDPAYSHQLEHRFVSSDGSFGHMAVRYFVVKDGHGKTIKIYGVNQDITAKQENIQQLEEAKVEAENANRAKSQFLSSMSHELRTPLNAILGFAQLLETSSELDEAQQESINHIVDGGQHLLDLINEVLDLAKIEAGNAEVSLEHVDIDGLLDNCQTLSSNLAKTNNITIKLDKDSATGLGVNADKVRIKQILLNLISNAIKYNNEGGEVCIKTEALKNGKVRLSVSDTGNGIPEEYQQDIFKPFKRLQFSKSQIEGTGIGLAITKDLVELMSGKIDFISDEGKGSTFCFELPASKVSKDEEDRASATQGGETSYPLPTSGTVLYVEDNAVNQMLMEGLFEALPGLTLKMASDGQSGIDMCQMLKPDLVLMDVQLPDMSGIEATKQLKASDETRAIPVIAVSANAMKSDIDVAMDAGMIDYLTKPFMLDELIALVSRVLSN